MQVGNLFTYYLPEIFIKNTKKLLIEFHKEPEALFVFPEKKNEDMYTIRETFLFDKFEKANDKEKTKLLLKSVYNCLVILFEKLELIIDDLNLAYKRIIENEFKLELKIAGGIKINKTKTLKAVVIAQHFLEYALISVNFLTIIGLTVEKIELFKVGPAFFFYSQLINKAKWINNEVFQVSNNSGEININVNVSGEISIHYFPKDRDKEDLKELIRYFTIERMVEI